MVISDHALAIVSNVSSSLSIIGSLALVALLLAFQFQKQNGDERWKPIQREMLMSLSICDFLTSCFYLVQPGTENCKWAAPATTFFACSAFLWTDAIALDVWRTVRYRWKQQTSRMCSFAVWCRFCCFGVPAVLAIIQFGADVSGIDEKWGSFCWIKSSPGITADLWRIESGKALEWFSFVFVSLCYISALCDLRKLSLPTHIISSISFRMMLVPGVFVLLRIPATAHLLASLAGVSEAQITTTDRKQWQLLLLLESAATPAQGFANSLVYLACHSQGKRLLVRLGIFLRVLWPQHSHLHHRRRHGKRMAGAPLMEHQHLGAAHGSELCQSVGDNGDVPASYESEPTTTQYALSYGVENLDDSLHSLTQEQEMNDGEDKEDKEEDGVGAGGGLREGDGGRSGSGGIGTDTSADDGGRRCSGDVRNAAIVGIAGTVDEFVNSQLPPHRSASREANIRKANIASARREGACETL